MSSSLAELFGISSEDVANKKKVQKERAEEKQRKRKKSP